jgi:hypothetical protein
MCLIDTLKTAGGGGGVAMVPLSSVCLCVCVSVRLCVCVSVCLCVCVSVSVSGSRLCFGGCSFVVVGSGTSRACRACTSWEELQPMKESSQPLCGSKMSILSSEDHYSRDPVQVQSSMALRTSKTASRNAQHGSFAFGLGCTSTEVKSVRRWRLGQNVPQKFRDSH